MTGPAGFALSSAGRVVSLEVQPGPGLLAAVACGPTLAAHRDVRGGLPQLSARELVELTSAVAMRGRGGAAFPFATKLAAAAEARGRPTVVVNLSEGEPASFKDSALALVAPHLVLDGALVVARALAAREIHLVLPGERDAVRRAMELALVERDERPVRTRVHVTRPGFVSGQARAVVELLSGRQNLPVTSWQPEAVRGYRDRPTLLSNAETFAQIAHLVTEGPSVYAGLGTPAEPGTTLLTLAGDTTRPVVREVPFGTAWTEVLGDRVGRPVLLGGYHGTWTRPETLTDLVVSREQLAGAGLTLGAGVVLPTDECPVVRSAHLAGYLAGESAGRCGPCFNGLPALASALRGVAAGAADPSEVQRLSALVVRRGACAHPDGVARMVASLLAAFPDEVARHVRGGCELWDQGLREVV